MIWRDDDVLRSSRDLGALLYVDDLLTAAGLTHTVAIMAETLTAPLAKIIRDRGMSAQVHCWSHEDLTVDLESRARLAEAVTKIEDSIGVRPTVLYPPWNRTSPALEMFAARLGLTVSASKISLDQYIRVRGDVSEHVVNFHYWHEPDRSQLATAVRIAQALVAA